MIKRLPLLGIAQALWLGIATLAMWYPEWVNLILFIIASGPVVGALIVVYHDVDCDVYDEMDRFFSYYDDAEVGLIDQHERWIRDNIHLLKPFRGQYVAIDIAHNTVIISSRNLDNFNKQLKAFDVAYVNKLIRVHADLFLEEQP